MLAWGRASDGQLGLGGIEDDCVTAPRLNKYLHNRKIKQIASGGKHTMFLVEGGAVLSCGSNEQGQLGQDKSMLRPGEVELLGTQVVTQLSCGQAHSVALSNAGQLHSWGCNSRGQLGYETSGLNYSTAPRLVKQLSDRVAVQVACGGNHCLALMHNGQLYSWGSSEYGQLGQSNLKHGHIPIPRVVASLESIPLLHIAAGSNHSFALSVSGTVYGFGRNNFGQLGIGHQNDASEPVQLKSLHSHRVVFVSCGEEHTAVLTLDGGIFTFGQGRHGQLGHGSTCVKTYPTQVFELMGSTVSQVACGRHHTMALVKNTGRVYTFGLASSGQLGQASSSTASATTAPKNTHAHTPTMVGSVRWTTVVKTQALTSDGGKGGGGGVGGGGRGEGACLLLPPSPRKDEGTSVDREEEGVCSPCVAVAARIFCGGDQSFVTLVQSEQDAAHDSRRPHPSSLPLYLPSLQRAQELILASQSQEDICSLVQRFFSSKACLNGSFLAESHYGTGESTHSGVDLACASQVFFSIRLRLQQLQAPQLLTATLCTELFPSLLSGPLPSSPECLRLFHSLPALLLSPGDPALEEVVPFIKAFLGLPSKHKTSIGNWLFNGSREYLHFWIDKLKGIIVKLLPKMKRSIDENEKAANLIKSESSPSMTEMDKEAISTGLELLSYIHLWNTTHKDVLSHTEFHIPQVTDVMDLVYDYLCWLENRPGMVKFCSYPFVLDPCAKAELMTAESRVQMHIAVHTAHRRNVEALFSSQGGLLDLSPSFLELTVNRPSLIRDTLAGLASVSQQDLKKPLKINFVGEEGFDAGGVQKEFFMLLLSEILDPNFGMFRHYDESNLIWFSDQMILYESLDHFTLIGVLCGLVIYNQVIVDLPFPTALYKKLLNKSVDLSDLTELSPSLGKGLEAILSYDGEDFEEQFQLSFELTRSGLDGIESVDLVQGGSHKPVTKDNRKDYVYNYVQYVLTGSVSEPFQAFSKGFMKVCEGKVIHMFHPRELMALVVGNSVLDWSLMEEHMAYKNGYTMDHPTIKLFWKVFHSLTLEAKKKFLVFFTGSNRIPVAGFKSMKMIMQKMDGGEGCNRLPVAHTCFNILDLPPYDSETKLRDKLLQAINFTSGFGIV